MECVYDPCNKHKPIKPAADWPECEEFYDLMQAYRHTPIADLPGVVAAYEAVKDWLRK